MIQFHRLHEVVSEVQVKLFLYAPQFGTGFSGKGIGKISSHDFKPVACNAMRHKAHGIGKEVQYPERHS